MANGAAPPAARFDPVLLTVLGLWTPAQAGLSAADRASAPQNPIAEPADSTRNAGVFWSILTHFNYFVIRILFEVHPGLMDPDHMARFATFDDALAIIQDNDRVSAVSLARALGASVQGAESLLERLRDEGHVDRASDDGWYKVIGTQSRRRWDRTGSGSTTPSGRIAVLEAENAELRHKLRELEERYALRSPDASGSGSRPGQGQPNDEIAQTRRRLRHLLARALHPDRAESNDVERNLHTDLFKRLWPEIEAVIGGRPSPREESF